MINKEEYTLKLKENKWFEDPKETLDYRFPVVEYYLKNIADSTSIVMTNLGPREIHIRNVDVIKPEVDNMSDFTLVNRAYNFIINSKKDE